jgi:putative membrane protein
MGYWGPGAWWFGFGWIPMVIVMIVFWGAVVWVAATWARSSKATKSDRLRNDADDPEQILARRFAAGEISEEEWRRRLWALRHPEGGPESH